MDISFGKHENSCSLESSKSVVSVRPSNISDRLTPSWQGRDVVWLELPCGSTVTSSGNCQETETCITLHDSLSKSTLQSTLEDGRRRGQRRKRWVDSIRVDVPAHHKGLLQKKDWKKISAESSLMSARRPNRSRALN